MGRFSVSGVWIVIFSLLLGFDIPYMQNLKRNDTNELIYKTESDSQRTNLRCHGGRIGGRDGELGIHMYTLLHLKWISTRSYCIAHGTLLNLMWQARWQESLGENEYMYLYG